MTARGYIVIGGEAILDTNHGDVTGFNDQFVTVRVPRSRVQMVELLPEPGIYVGATGVAVYVGAGQTDEQIRHSMRVFGPLERLTRMPHRTDVEEVLALAKDYYQEDLIRAVDAVMKLLVDSRP